MLDRHNNALRSFNSVVKPTRQQTVLVLYLDFNEDVAKIQARVAMRRFAGHWSCRNGRERHGLNQLDTAIDAY
jgi:hypothetical protein